MDQTQRVGGGINTYAYVGNNPLVVSDLYGLNPLLGPILGPIIEATGIAAASVGGVAAAARLWNFASQRQADEELKRLYEAQKSYCSDPRYPELCATFEQTKQRYLQCVGGTIQGGAQLVPNTPMIQILPRPAVGPPPPAPPNQPR